jgi:hypothetical protein
MNVSCKQYRTHKSYESYTFYQDLLYIIKYLTLQLQQHRISRVTNGFKKRL